MTTQICTSNRALFRCMIPECELTNGTSDEQYSVGDYTPQWLQQAVPYESNGKPSQCRRYATIGRPSNESELSDDQRTCGTWTFDQSKVIECDEFVYATQEVTIVNEVSVQNM